MAMKGRKATYQERKILEKKGYDTHIWLIQKNSPDFIQIVNRDTKEEVKLTKCSDGSLD